MFENYVMYTDLYFLYPKNPVSGLHFIQKTEENASFNEIGF